MENLKSDKNNFGALALDLVGIFFFPNHFWALLENYHQYDSANSKIYFSKQKRKKKSQKIVLLKKQKKKENNIMNL